MRHGNLREELAPITHLAYFFQELGGSLDSLEEMTWRVGVGRGLLSSGELLPISVEDLIALNTKELEGALEGGQKLGLLTI